MHAYSESCCIINCCTLLNCGHYVKPGGNVKSSIAKSPFVMLFPLWLKPISLSASSEVIGVELAKMNGMLLLADMVVAVRYYANLKFGC